MNDCLGARRYRISPRDWQMLAAAYFPVIAFAAVTAARILRTRRHQLQAALR